MPVPRWFPISISQDMIPGGFLIILKTDIPAHLFLFWTDKEPWVHPVSTIERGLAVPWNAYWCFVTWHLIEQEEAGDTTTHTFIWTGWVTCQTKWFRFHGTIASNPSPSDSPIFHKHYVAPAYGVILDYPPSDPLARIGNRIWHSTGFIAGRTGTPQDLEIWLKRTDARVNGCDVYIEEIFPGSLPYPIPYRDLAGHMLAHAIITNEQFNDHHGVWWNYSATFFDAVQLTEGQWYCLTNEAKGPRPVYLDRAHTPPPEPPNQIFTYAVYSGTSNRNWLGVGYADSMAVKVQG